MRSEKQIRHLPLSTLNLVDALDNTTLGSMHFVHDDDLPQISRGGTAWRQLMKLNQVNTLGRLEYVLHPTNEKKKQLAVASP